MSQEKNTKFSKFYYFPEKNPFQIPMDYSSHALSDTGMYSYVPFGSKIPVLVLLFSPGMWRQYMFSADPDRIGLLGKPPAAEHSFPSSSQ
jgi:hypothetical protein